MRFTLHRDSLLKPLQMAGAVADKRNALPILANVLFQAEAQTLSITASDLEVELVALLKLEQPLPKLSFTLPAKKLLDICKSLPENSSLEFVLTGERATVRSGKSRFVLTTLPVDEYPILGGIAGNLEFLVRKSHLKMLIEQTQFAMASQDVRYYLNGLLVQLEQDKLVTVGTDGHRLAFSEALLDSPQVSSTQFILPRKGVLELAKLLSDQDTLLTLAVDKHHLTVKDIDFIFTSKLIDGRFPDYQRVFPKQTLLSAVADRDQLKVAISRASILSNEKHRGIRIQFSNQLIRVAANNPEQEEAEEEIEAQYDGDFVEIGFNAMYLLDILATIPPGPVAIRFNDTKSSTLFESKQSNASSSYIVMPLQI